MKKIIRICLILIIMFIIGYIFKPQVKYLEYSYKDVMLSLLETKRIIIYDNRHIINQQTGEEINLKPVMVSDYKDVFYFTNLVIKSPLITEPQAGATIEESSYNFLELSLLDFKNNELLRIKVNNSLIAIKKRKESYMLENIYFNEINDFLEKYKRYGF